MLKIALTLVFTACFFDTVYATSFSDEKHPVDVCFMVADLKYNTRQGVKICEIQQASLSLFNGDKYRCEEEVSIHKELLNSLSQYNQQGWVVAGSIADRNLVSMLATSPMWRTPQDLGALFSDPSFKTLAKQPAKDIYDISSYQGFLYISWAQLSAIPDFEKRLPGIVVMDKSSFSFWIDKYKMTKLFAEDELLSTIKPKWGNYRKIYTKELASQIASDLGGETFVIKPRGEFLGNGVIITQKQDLDDVLFYIINKKGKLATVENPAYTMWKKDPFDSFIVEEFVASDPITIPHLENKTYQPTMRVAFLLVYNNHSHHVHFLGSYWKTPSLSINEEGDFMEKNKDICQPPYYYAVDSKTMQAVHKQLSATLPVLHRKMLEVSNSQEEYCTPIERKRVHFILEKVHFPSCTPTTTK